MASSVSQLTGYADAALVIAQQMGSTQCSVDQSAIVEITQANETFSQGESHCMFR